MQNSPSGLIELRDSVRNVEEFNIRVVLILIFSRKVDCAESRFESFAFHILNQRRFLQLPQSELVGTNMVEQVFALVLDILLYDSECK